MDVKELRIGNYLEYYGQFVEVLDIFRDGSAEFGYFSDSIGFKRYLCEKQAPAEVALTDSILTRLGMVKVIGWDDMEFWREKSDAKNADCFELLVTNQGYEMDNGKICKYLHQLQNCYYFHQLNGQELTFNR